MATIPEDYVLFSARQACPRLVVKHRVLFENGAQSNGWTHLEPPADYLPRARLQLEYAIYALKKEERDFANYQAYCLGQNRLAQRYKNLPSAPAEADAQLRAGQRRINALRVKIDELTAEIGERDRVNLDIQRMLENDRMNAIRLQEQRIKSVSI